MQQQQRLQNGLGQGGTMPIPPNSGPQVNTGPVTSQPMLARNSQQTPTITPILQNGQFIQVPGAVNSRPSPQNQPSTPVRQPAGQQQQLPQQDPQMGQRPIARPTPPNQNVQPQQIPRTNATPTMSMRPSPAMAPTRGVKRPLEDDAVQNQQQQTMERQMSQGGRRPAQAPQAVMAPDASGHPSQQTNAMSMQITPAMRDRVFKMSNEFLRAMKQMPPVEMSPQDKATMVQILEKVTPQPNSLDRILFFYLNFHGEDASRELMKAIVMIKCQIAGNKPRDSFSITLQQANDAITTINNCKKIVYMKFQRNQEAVQAGMNGQLQTSQTQSPQRNLTQTPQMAQQGIARTSTTPQANDQQPQQTSQQQAVAVQRQLSKQGGPQQQQLQQQQPQQQQGKTTPQNSTSPAIFHQAPDGVPVYDNSAEKPINLQWPPAKKSKNNLGQASSNVPPPAPITTKPPPFPEIRPQQQQQQVQRLQQPVPQKPKMGELPVTKIIPEPAPSFRCQDRACGMVLKNKEEYEKHAATHKSHLVQVWERVSLDQSPGEHCLEIVGTSLGVIQHGADRTGSPSGKTEQKMKLEDDDDVPMMDKKKEQLLQTIKQQEVDMPTPPALAPDWRYSHMDRESVLECFEALSGIEGVISNSNATMLTPAYTPPLNEASTDETSKTTSRNIKDDKDDFEEDLSETDPYKPFGHDFGPMDEVDWDTELGFSVAQTNDWTPYFEV